MEAPATPPQLVGLIGHPLGHSRSPAMQQAAFDALGVPARYELWDTPPDALASRIAALRAPHILGANVTIPHKVAALSLLDVIDPQALRAAGAINTIVRVAAAGRPRLHGYNTDIPALRRVLREHDALTPVARLLILGAGGAARAAIGAALLEGVSWLGVAARQSAAAQAALDERLQSFISHPTDPAIVRPPVPTPTIQAFALADTAALSAALARATIVINATPIGTRDPTASPLDATLLAALPPTAFIFDMVYNPPQTALVLAAHARGLRASGGVPMLLYQGAEAFTLWTRQPAPLAVMRAALLASLTS